MAFGFLRWRLKVSGQDQEGNAVGTEIIVLRHRTFNIVLEDHCLEFDPFYRALGLDQSLGFCHNTH